MNGSLNAVFHVMSHVHCALLQDTLQSAFAFLVLVTVFAGDREAEATLLHAVGTIGQLLVLLQVPADLIHKCVRAGVDDVNARVDSRTHTPHQAMILVRQPSRACKDDPRCCFGPILGSCPLAQNPNPQSLLALTVVHHMQARCCRQEIIQ